MPCKTDKDTTKNLPDFIRKAKFQKLLRLALSFAFVLLCWSFLLGYIIKGAETSGYFWQWFRVQKDFLHLATGQGLADFFHSPLFMGLVTTLKLAFFSIIFSFALALICTAMNMAGGTFAKLLAKTYIEIIRNTPLLVQLFLMYTVVAPPLNLSANHTAIITLSLCHAAFMSEALRSGILAVPKAQYEAALSLGLPPALAILYIILPQAIRFSLPPLLNQSVILIKDTSLASVISVTELTFQAKFYASASFTVFETWLTVAGVYLIICISFSSLAALVQRLLTGSYNKSDA